jgi:3-methylfumaryl-CoA hydratase
MATDTTQWIGRKAEAQDVLHAERVAALWAALDRGGPPPGAGEALPPLWHWLYFWALPRRSDLGPDGHPARGGIVPDLPEGRRMWAGSSVTFHRPLAIGAAVTRRSTVANVTEKTGRGGRLVFIEVAHEIGDEDGPALTDRHHIVYRPPPDGTPPRAPEPAPATADRAETWQADSSLLFRYSALTYNGHRIHYDHPYATREEGYPGLVVHGPLLATLMAANAQALHPDRPLASFAFRATAPVFANEPFTVMADRRGAVWVRRADGGYATRGEVAWA